MPRTSASQVDPVFAEIAKAIYGDVDPREVAELAKFSPDGSDLHIPGAGGPKKPKNETLLAATGLGATGVATVGGMHAINATVAEHNARMAAAGSEPHKLKVQAKEVKDAARLARGKTPVARLGRVLHSPTRAAAVVGAGWGVLHGVELTGDALAARAQVKTINANKQKPDGTSDVVKAFRLRPLNPGMPHVPSLRAKRPAMNPLPNSPTAPRSLFRPVGKAWFPKSRRIFHNVDVASQHLGPILTDAHQATQQAVRATADASDAAAKAKKLIPSRKTAAVIGGAGLVGVGAASGAGTYTANRLSERKTQRVKLRAKQDRLARLNQTRATQGGPSLVPVAKAWGKGIYGNVRRTTANAAKASDRFDAAAANAEKVTGHAEDTAKHISDIAGKVSNFIPTKRTAGIIVGTGAAAMAGAGYAGAHAGGESLTRRRLQRQDRKAWEASRQPTLVPVAKAWFRNGIYGNVRRVTANAEKASNRFDAVASHAEKVTTHAEDAAKHVNDVATKVGALIPSKKALLIGGAVNTAGSAGLTYLGAREGAKSASRKYQMDKETGRSPQQGQPRRIAKSVTWYGEIAKVDADKRQVFGWASVSSIGGEPVLDLQGDIVPIDEMEKSAYRYVLESRKGGDMHARVRKSADSPKHTADMIESFVVTPEKLEGMGLDPYALPHGWWVGFKVNDDDQWNLVKSGQRTGFSIHGSGRRTPSLSKLDVGEIKDKVSEQAHRAAGSLRTRFQQAAHPPEVKLKPVRSAMATKMGYQPQTRRLVYEMGTNPKRTYTYRAKKEIGQGAVSAQSPGGYYNANVKNKVEATDKVSPVGRLRLFVHPDVSKALAPKPPSSAAPPAPVAGSPSQPAAGGTPAPQAKKQPMLKPLAPAVPPVPLPGTSTLRSPGAAPAGSPAPTPMPAPAKAKAAPAKAAAPAGKGAMAKASRIPPKWTPGGGIAGVGAAGPRLPRKPRTAEQIAQGKKDRADREAQRLWIKRFKG